MKSILMVCMVSVGLCLLCIGGCEKKESTKDSQIKQSAKTDVPMLCPKCGQIMGSQLCCKPDAEKCRACGLAKGSPACCKNIDFSYGPVPLCTHCGEVKGSPRCCAIGVEKCSVCGLNKGSPGCCRIKKAP